PCGVFQRVHWQIGDASADRIDAHDGFVDAPYCGAIADTGHALTENIETDRNIADAGRREGGRRHHRRAPSAAPRRSKSAKIPAAVTSRPAPGPCTISGL